MLVLAEAVSGNEWLTLQGDGRILTFPLRYAEQCTWHFSIPIQGGMLDECGSSKIGYFTSSASENKRWGMQAPEAN